VKKLLEEALVSVVPSGSTSIHLISQEKTRS
jgi:hypothetical protein